jgi:flagellar basal-body rod modification protein FlgD
MDNAAMTSQLAQLNTVDGINRLNTSMGSMIAQMQSANFMNLSASVGKMALAAGKDVYFGGQAVTMAAKLTQPASSLTATIKDASGQIVNELDFGAVGAGVTDFIWDGKNDAGDTVATGVYTLELKASDAQGQSLLPDPYVGAMVASVGMDGSDLRAGLSDGRNVLTSEILKWVMI